MSGVEASISRPDPAWPAEVLVERAEACTELTAAWLAPLAALRPELLDPDDRLTLALVLQRMVAVTDALALTALAHVADRPCRTDPGWKRAHPEAAARTCPGGSRCLHGWEVEELSALTGLPRWTMGTRWAWSRQLSSDWAPLAPLLAGGRITTEHLRRFDRATYMSGPEATRAAADAAA